MTFMTDTGGGLNMLFPNALERHGLVAQPAELPYVQEEFGEQARHVRMTPWPAFASGQGIPKANRGYEASRAWDEVLLIMPVEDRLSKEMGAPEQDGFLGNMWFSNRVWTWDYPAGKFYQEQVDFRPDPAATGIPLGFRTQPNGERAGFPRMHITVDGQALPVLLDTGAQTVLTPEALRVIHDGGPAFRATSMISDDVFQAWRTKHPDWRFIEKGQAATGSAMIEVPEVEIAGQRVGPVWFTHRPNANFHEFMSSMMDARVEGAVGGNAFSHFVMTVDYPNARAYFRCVVDCRPPVPVE